jgi:hypothetical protein
VTVHTEQPHACPLPRIGETEPRASGRRTTVLAVLLILAGVANNAHCLRWGFQYDDYVHQLALRHLVPTVHLRCWNLYNFGGRPGPSEPLAQQGLFPWWTDSDFKVRFFRPVTSLSIYLDSLLYRDWAPGYHLTGLAWFAVFLALAFRLYRDLGAPASAALWGLAFLALDDIPYMPVGWIANRNALLAAVFVVATILAVHHHRRTGRGRYSLLAAVCFLLACGSKESGLIALPIAALYLVLFDPAFAGLSRRDACLRLLRSRTLWVLGLLAVAYVGFYLAAGYGTRSGLYSTPWLDTAGYLRRLATLVPLGLLSLFFGFPTDLLFRRPELVWPMAAVAGCVLAVVGVIVFRVVRWKPLSIFALGWVLFALPPEAAADLYDRLFMNASVGSALMIGLFLHRLAPVRDRVALRQYPRLALGGAFVLFGIVASVPSTAIRSGLWSQLAALDRDIAVEADIPRPPAASQTVFLLNCPSSMLAWSMLPTWAVVYDDPVTRLFPLQFGRRALTWTRDGDHTMTLRCAGQPFLDNHFERLFRTHRAPPAVGARYETSEFVATVVAVEPTGIRTVRFDFKKSLDDASYRFLAWRNGRMSRVATPAAGQTVEIPAIHRLLPFAP